MDVLGILETQGGELLDIDLDCLEDELLLDEYDAGYVWRCRTLIDGIRRSREQGEQPVKNSDEAGAHGIAQGSTVGSSVFVPSDALSPFNKDKLEQAVSPSEMVARDLAVIRRSSDEERGFETYLTGSEIIDEAFVDQHIDLFNEVELKTIVREVTLSETFLEKYFDVLDHKVLSECQRFSEEFFIKHYAELDVTAVLRRSPNEWRRKGRRSSKLDVFLRLKGVRI